MSDATCGCRHGAAQVMQDMVMDVVRALSSPNLDIRRKTLDIALELITPRNIDEVVLTLKKEVVKTQNRELEKNGEYRQMLVQVRVSPTLR
jgi:coatomer subunit beta